MTPKDGSNEKGPDPTAAPDGEGVTTAPGLFRALVDGASQGICVHAKFKPLFANHAMARLLGYDDTEAFLALDDWSCHFDPRERERIHEYHLARLAGEPAPVDYEFLGIKANGAEVWLNNRSFKVDWQGTPAVCTVVFDVTLKKLAEDQLRVTQYSLENAKDALFWIGPDSRIHYANQTACDNLGYHRAEILAMKVHDFSAGPPDKTPWETHWNRLKEGGSITYETVHFRKDNTSFPVEVTSSFLEYEGREYNFSFVRDITRRNAAKEALEKAHSQLEARVRERTAELEEANRRLTLEMETRAQAERERAESELKFSQLVDQAADAVLVHDLEGRFVEANPAACQCLGYAREELLTMTVFDIDIINGGENAPSIKQAWRAMEPDQHVTFLGRHRRKDGSDFPAEIRVGVMRSAGGPLFLALSRDMTERTRVEEALRQAKAAAESASRAKSEFLANMSHEIRSPMNAIIGMTDLVLESTLESDQRQYLEMVQESADNLLFLINAILDFSKIEAGRLEIENTRFEVRPLMEKACQALAVTAEKNGLNLLFSVDPGVPDFVMGDPHRLRQITINLVNNAIKFTREGEVAIRLWREPGEMLHLQVSDTGIGIATEKQAAIFNDFTQADGSTTRKFGGSGLGLSISRKLTEMMGGRIWVESIEGEGSVFHVTLPAPEAERPLPPTGAGNFSDLSLLIAEGHSPTRSALERSLTALGARTGLASNGEEAVDRLRRADEEGIPFQGLFLDDRLPGIGALTADHLSDNLPPLILLLPTASRGTDNASIPGLEPAAALTKPVRRTALGRVLRTLFPRPPPPRESNGSSQGPLGVLVAEDTMSSRILAEDALTRAGHRPVLAENGREALEKLAVNDIDIILMDVHMPGLDGLGATRLIRNGEIPGVDPRIPIGAVTASALPEERKRCLDAGMDDFLAKPYKPAELLAFVARMGRIQRRDEPPPTAPTLSAEAFTVAARPLAQALKAALSAEDYSAMERAAQSLKETAMQTGTWGDEIRKNAFRAVLAARNKDLDKARSAYVLLKESLGF